MTSSCQQNNSQLYHLPTAVRVN